MIEKQNKIIWMSLVYLNFFSRLLFCYEEFLMRSCCISIFSKKKIIFVPIKTLSCQLLIFCSHIFMWFLMLNKIIAFFVSPLLINLFFFNIVVRNTTANASKKYSSPKKLKIFLKEGKKKVYYEAFKANISWI